MRFRYDAELANEIELRWQDHWESNGTFATPNPSGPLSGGFERMVGRPKAYVLDFFPYPSGAGLHVGHPLGYIATDAYARYLRMTGHNVLHPFGYDAFGLPAEQYAIDTGQHPAVTTAHNIAVMRRQLRRFGMVHDRRREFATSDPAYYRWTQWIFLRLFGSWYDEGAARARPIEELVAEFASGRRSTGDGRLWTDLDPVARRRIVNAHRLAYVSAEPVNWCPALGTVLANEEVTADGRSDVGNHPVYRRPMRQWMLRITAYAERLLADLDALDWPESTKTMQRNWIGRRDGAEVDVAIGPHVVRVFTDRPDTLADATALVLAPDHPLVDRIAAGVDALRTFRQRVSRQSDRQRTASDERAFTGAYAANPRNGGEIPVYVAASLLSGAVLEAPHDGPPDVEPAIAWLEATGVGRRARTYRLRDWLFSRQRYWGEPFPIVYDEHGLPVALPDAMLPVRLPEMADFRPRPGEGEPVPPLGRATDWADVELDLGDGPRRYRRELNTMPQWAGSCWYHLRYPSPSYLDGVVDPVAEAYWLGPDLYVGGAEQAVLHLLYARFWHKVLYDLGYVATPEPYRRLVHQGYVQADAFTDARGRYVPAAEVVRGPAGDYTYRGEPVQRRSGKMGKSLKNGISPDDVYATYGADTLRLCELATGPLDVDRPWRPADMVGVHRFLQRLWRNVVDEHTGESTVDDSALDEATARALHRTVKAVGEQYAALRFNTAVARLTELNAVASRVAAARHGRIPRALAEPLVLMVAPLAPHVAEELWSKLGHPPSVGWAPFPAYDETLAVAPSVVLPVQVDGRVVNIVTR